MSGRKLGTWHSSPASVSPHREAEGRENVGLPGRRNIEAAQRPDPRRVEREPPLERRNGTGNDQLRSIAAADVEDHAGGNLDAGQDEGRVDAPLEAVAGVRLDPELAPGGRGAHRIEQRCLEEHVHRLVGAARALAADDAADRFHILVIGDHRHLGIERIGPAVERRDGLARPRQADVDIALDPVGVEDMQGAGRRR